MAREAKRARLEEKEKEREESEEESSEEVEIRLALDDDGRVGCDSPPQYQYRCFPELLQGWLKDDKSAWDSFRTDCQAAFTARATQSGQAYSAGETFWIGADVEKPATLMERLALEIFWLHAGSSAFDKCKSGAEWWTLAMDAEDDVGWHWDRDYGLEADTGFQLHPHVATVTYVSDLGAPTLVLEAIEAEDSKQAVTPQAAHWSMPKAGKHISFDGRWLHAAPQSLCEHNPNKGTGKRITFLVNVWLNHKPQNVVPCRAASLSSASAVPQCMGENTPVTELIVPRVSSGSDDKGSKTFTWTFHTSGGEESAEEEQDVPEDRWQTGQRRVRIALPLSSVASEHGKDGRLPPTFSVDFSSSGCCAVEPVTREATQA